MKRTTIFKASLFSAAAVLLAACSAGVQTTSGQSYLDRYSEQTRHYQPRTASGGFAAQDPRMLDHLVGYFQSDVGPLNQIVHIWKYDDVAQRDEIRKANYARADWVAHLAKIRPLMVSQETTLLVPSPVAGMCPLAES